MRSNVHDSNGPNIRVRGNAYQVMEKYLAMARDAAAAGDRIAAENYYQHAEHYFRTLNANAGNGSGDHRHHQHMHTPSDPMGDDLDGDEDMPGAPMNAQNAHAMRAPEPPRIDPAQQEQPHTDMAAPAPGGGPQPYEGRRRGPNGRRRPGPHDGHGQRHGGNGQGGQGAPQRDPRSISPASPAEAASTDSDSTEPETPSDA